MISIVRLDTASDGDLTELAQMGSLSDADRELVRCEQEFRRRGRELARRGASAAEYVQLRHEVYRNGGSS